MLLIFSGLAHRKGRFGAETGHAIADSSPGQSSHFCRAPGDFSSALLKLSVPLLFLLLASTGLLSAFSLSPPAAQTPTEHELTVRALELYRSGNCKEAEPLMEKVLLHQPRNIAVRKLLGKCLLREKRNDESRMQFQLVLDIAPQDVEALQGLRASVAGIQKREEGKQALTLESRAATAEQFRSAHELRSAEQLIKDHRLEEAETILQILVRDHPDLVPAQQRLAEIYSATKRFDKAAEVYSALAEKPGASSAFLLRLAQNLQWRKDYPQSIKSYRLYLEKRPDDLSAEMELTHVLMWSAQYREALPQLEHLQIKRPKDVRVLLALAQCHEQLSETDQALQAYERVLELDPTNPTARAARTRHAQYLDQLPRQKAFAALEKNDYEGAAKLFAEYLQKHPDSIETVLQIARVYSWAQRYPEAEHYYEEYLHRAPQDFVVMRELAELELWAQNYEAAKKYFALLVGSSAATTADYESLIHAHTWSGDLEGAEPYAKKLAKLDPNNPVARETLNEILERQKLSARHDAEELAAAGRYPEAVQAYRRYMDNYGKTQEFELMIARLYGWGKDSGHATQAYRDYLQRYPQDLTARLELANIENWAREYDEAENDYRAVLLKEPHNVSALIGMAQVTDYRGDDPFKVQRHFKKVLAADPNNSVAAKRIEEIRPQVAPTLGYLQSSFWDSDGLYRSVNSLEATFPLPGRIKISPFYTSGYFHELRLPRELGRASVPQGSVLAPLLLPQIQDLNKRIGDLNGTVLGNGGGGRLELWRGARWYLLGEAGAVRFDQAVPCRLALCLPSALSSNRTSLNARAEASFHPGENTSLGLTYVHRDAIYDLNTVASLAAGIMGDTLLISYQRPVVARLRFWASGGGTRFSRGIDSRFSSNTLRQLAARLDYQVHPSVTLGYSFRLNSFISPSPLYFSPSLYQTHGLAGRLDHRISRKVRVSADGEIGYGRITTLRELIPAKAIPTIPACSLTTSDLAANSNIAANCSINTFELAVVPTLSWQVRHDWVLRLGYRFSRGRGSAFGSPVYRTMGADFGLSKVF